MERSTLAWFRAADPDPSNALDDTALLIARLRATRHIDVITETHAHDFVWRHFRTPYDLCVYELRDDTAHRFILPYLVHYPGIVLVRGWPHGADRLWPLAQVIVTPHSAAVQTLRDAYPDAHVRFAPAGVRDVEGQDEVVVALEWPVTGEALTIALAGMAAGKAVVVFETEDTADWPALNPQTWRPRDFRGSSPIIVSIDPRDERHSLTLAMQRLSTDAALRGQLGAAAREWWNTHATVDHAVQAWEAIIAEARTLPPPLHSAEWVAPEDGTARAREILAEFGVSVDLF